MSSSSHRSHLAYADGDTQLDGETDLELSGRAMRYLFLANFDKGLNLVSRPSRYPLGSPLLAHSALELFVVLLVSIC